MNNFLLFIQHVIGFDYFSLGDLGHMLIRGFIVYLVGVVLVRFNKKLIGIRTPFNFILFVMLGSIFASAIIDESHFLSIMGTTFFLMFINGVVTILTFYFDQVESLVRGDSAILVKDGKIEWKVMQKNFITKRELLDQLNTQMHTNDLKAIKYAILTSDGTINFIVQDNTQ